MGKQFLSLFGVLSLCTVLMFGCEKKEESTGREKSDPKAIEIAKQVIEACGGLENWRETRYVAWRCLGKRMNVWDKWTGDLRSESRVSILLMNLNTMEGQAWLRGRKVTDPAELQRAMEYGYEAWVNDSYWIFMPFKLLDDGVILQYLREDSTDGHSVDVLRVTFDDVGLTPENKYHIYIDKESKLMVRWDFFINAEDTTPRFTTPWEDYKKYGDILLSGGRGVEAHEDIAVFQELPAEILNKPDRPDWDKLIPDPGSQTADSTQAAVSYERSEMTKVQ